MEKVLLKLFSTSQILKKKKKVTETFWQNQAINIKLLTRYEPWVEFNDSYNSNKSFYFNQIVTTGMLIFRGVFQT